MSVRHSVHESVWKALKESSGEERSAALEKMLYGTSSQETLEHMVLRTMLLYERPKVPFNMSDRHGISKIQQLAEEGSDRIRTNLELMDVVVAFPDFCDGPLSDDLDVLRPRMVEFSQTSPDHFIVYGEHTTSNSQNFSPTRYPLRADRVLYAASNPERARQQATPETISRTPLIIGKEAVSEYFATLKQYAEEYPNSEASQVAWTHARAAMRVEDGTEFSQQSLAAPLIQLG